jgi:hypothetical protein
MTTTRLKLSNCPRCDCKLDAASSTFDDIAIPKPGDVTICIKCAVVLTFTEDLGLSIATDSYLRELDPDTREKVASVQLAIVALNFITER